MTLLELNPQFISAGGNGISNADGTPAPERHGIGLMCDCPCGCGSKMFIPFRNPMDGGAPNDVGRPTWERTGETFETMTLSPSIKRIPFDGSCGWHGFIKNGAIEHCSDSTPATEEFKARMREEAKD